MNILIIAASDHYRDFIGKSYFDLINYYRVHSRNNIILFYSDERKLNIIKYLNQNKVDLILFLDTDTIRIADNYKKLLNYKIPIACACLDFFWISKCYNCFMIKNSKAIIHFGYASKLISSYKERFPLKKHLAFNSRYINVNRFKDYKLEKKYDILIYGTVDISKKRPVENHKADIDYKNLMLEKGINIGNKHSFYPLRRKIAIMFGKDKYKNRFRFHRLKGRCIHDAVVANEDLSKLINSSYITLATSSRADILMHKYLEIGASYSCILGNIPTDYKELLEGNIIEINEFMSEDEIADKIEYYLKNKKELEMMTRRLGDIIHKRYNFKEAIKDMDNILEQI